MRVLVTSGGTRERLDGVRCMSNISTGKLGSIIAKTFHNNMHQVTYLHTSTAEIPNRTPSMATAQGVVVPIKCIEADSVHEVYAEMERLVPEHDVVIHAMAVSDFTFDSDAMVKIKSTDIDSLRKVFMESMKVAPKILPMIKKWNSAIILIGFKFEVGVSYDRLIEIARGQMLECHCDLVLANDKEEIKKANSHIGYILSKDPDEGIIRCRDKKNIAHMLLRQIKANLW